MSFFKKLFGLTSNTSSSEPTNREPLKGNPLEGQENEIHVKRIEKYTEGDTIIYFHFPGYERDIFSIKLIEDEFTKNKVVKPHGIHSYMADKVEMYSQYDTIFQIGLLSDKKANYITFGAYQKAIKFNLNDKVSILFDDEEIWEFRTEFNSIQYRLLAFWDKRDKKNTLVIATNGFVKKRNKIPKSELERAKRIRNQYFIEE